MIRKLLVVLLFSILINTIFYARKDFIFEKIIDRDNLFNLTPVYSILQDHQGFIWCGTEEGLTRYDGYEFKLFRYNSSDPYSLSSNHVRVLYEDKSKILWVGTYGGGLNEFNREKENFTAYTHNPIHPDSLSDNHVFAIFEDSEGHMWIGTENGLNKFNRKTGCFTTIGKDPAAGHRLNNNRIRAISEDNSGLLWIGTLGGGLIKLNRKSQVISSYKNNPAESNSLSNDQILTIYPDKSGLLWIGTFGGGLNIFDPRKEIFVIHRHEKGNLKSLSNDYVTSICEDNSKQMYIATLGGGLNIFDMEKKSFTSYLNDPLNPYSIKDNRIWSIYKSNKDLLWLGTYGTGLTKLKLDKNMFKTYKVKSKSHQGLRHNTVSSIWEDRDGFLWVGTLDGLNKLDRNKNKFTVFRNIPGKKNSLNDNTIWTVMECQQDHIWIGTPKGLNKYDRKNNSFEIFSHNPAQSNSLSNSAITIVFEDNQKILWIGTYGGGLNKFDQEKEVFTSYQNDPNNPKSLSNNNITDITEDRDGILWVGTLDGLSRFDRGREQFKVYKINRNDPYGLSGNSINTVFEDSQGIIWIGTLTGGLNCLDKQSEKFRHYTIKDGLPSNSIKGIIEDDEGNLWISSFKGLTKIEITRKMPIPFSDKSWVKIRNYDRSDGLAGIEFTSTAILKNKQGEIILGGLDGLTIFHPNDLKKTNQHIPPLAITDFQLFFKSVPVDVEVNNRLILNKAINEIREITLSYKQNYISFFFSALDFTNPLKNQYAYMIEDLNSEWINLGTKRNVDLILQPGEYILRIKGSNNDGIWNEEGKSIKIKIIPPVWQTTWFQLLAVLMIMISVIALFKVRTKNIKKRARQLEEKNELLRKQIALRKQVEDDKLKLLERLRHSQKMEAIGTLAGGIAHDFNNILATILGFTELTLKEFPEEGKIRNNLKRVMRSSLRAKEMIQQIFMISRRTEVKMQSVYIAEIIKETTNQLRFSLPPNVKILTNISKNLKPILGDAIQIQEVITNIANNGAYAMRKTGGTLRIILKEVDYRIDKKGHLNLSKGKYQQLIIQDSGPGIDQELLSRIFEPYFTTKKDGEGMGMGLAVVYGIVKNHDGEITVSSKSGKGTAFHIYFPVSKKNNFPLFKKKK